MAAPDRPIPELERVRNLCYQQGKEFLSAHPASRALLARLEEECPHVSMRDLVLLFHLGDPEIAKAAAHRLEYNAIHPRKPPGDPDLGPDARPEAEADAVLDPEPARGRDP